MADAYCIVKPYKVAKEAGMHHWRVSLGLMSLLIVASSHQAAKRVALAYWALHGEHFIKAVRQRIAEKWRGGLKARREGTNLGASETDVRWYPA